MEQFLSTLTEFIGPPPLTRLGFLYSYLETRRETNPTGFNSAIIWWRTFLTDLVAKGLLGNDVLILSVKNDMRESLRWEKVGRPSSLGTIITELAKSDSLTRLEHYTQNQKSSFSLISTITSPLTWSFGLLKSSLSSGNAESLEEARWKEVQGDWVISELVEKAASGLISHLQDLHADEVCRLYTIHTFQSVVGNLCLEGVELSQKDCRALIYYLSEVKQLCTVRNDLIKFGSPFDSLPPKPITSSDGGIFTLLMTIKTLTAQIQQLSSQILTQKSKISKSYSQQQMILVKSELIRKKQLEILREKRVGSRDRIGEILFSIEKAVGDEATMAAYNLGTTTLRDLLSSPNLSLDSIDETTILLTEALADAAEITTAIDQATPALTSNQQEEIDQELLDMINEQTIEAVQIAEQLELEESHITTTGISAREEERRVESIAARIAGLGTPGTGGFVSDGTREAIAE